MAKYYQDFVGLNFLIYEPNGWDVGGGQIDLYADSGVNEDIVGLENMLFEFTGITRNHFVFGVAQNSIGWQGLSSNPWRIGGGAQLAKFKNYHTIKSVETGLPLALPNSASFFPALMLYRNGPYGWPSWKQIRIGENPLTRKQRKHNVITIVDEPGEEFEFRQGNTIRRGRARYGSILKYNECPIVSKYDPVSLFGGSRTTGTDKQIFRMKVKASLGNEISYFDNQSLNKKLGLKKATSRDYEKLVDLYLNGGLKSKRSPIDMVEVVKYKEAVYPPLLYTFKNYTRQRTTFGFPWNSDRALRKMSASGSGDISDNGFGWPVWSASMWPMDAYNGWTEQAERNGNYRWDDVFGYVESGTSNGGNQSHFTGDAGILQNCYSFGAHNLSTWSKLGQVGKFMRPAPFYAWKSTLIESASVVSQNGMFIEGINYGISMGDMDKTNGIPGGTALWEAASQSGKAPFYNSYDEYIQGAKQLGKDYTIIPEFRISNHVSKYHTQGLNVLNPHFLELTGGLSNTTGSNQTNFYTIFSNSDFLENFKMVREQHKDLVEPVNIKLTCKAIKKLLPYEGFYPVQRTVDIAKQFYSSYYSHTSASAATDVIALGLTPTGSLDYAFQNMLTPICAPGVLFNSIKSGVACDYPMVTASLALENENIYTGGAGKNDNGWYISVKDHGAGGVSDNTFPGTPIVPPTVFGQRVPFEVMVEPERYLANQNLKCQNPNYNGNHSGSLFWDGQGDNLFKLMSHNFLAETSNFFMKNENYTTIYSKPNNNPMVGMAQAGMTYTMRIKMIKSSLANQSRYSASYLDETSEKWLTPQYNTGSSEDHETFTMYSNPQAFGPPVYVSGTYDLSSTDYSHQLIPSASKGMNLCYTPPYYYGEAWCDLEFNPSETRKHSIHEIIQQSTASYWRWLEPQTFQYLTSSTAGGNNLFNQKNDVVNKNALQLSASVNLFGLERDESGDLNEETARWVIQTKWETPMLNFNHLSASDSITLPNNASQSVPRGMWHQYGRIEEDPSKGIFLQVTEIPDTFTARCLNKNPNLSGSLADLVGFSSSPIRLGQIADAKKVFEAVVAIPFIEEQGDQKFFTLPREDINLALDPDRNDRVGQSVKKMVQKMQKYVFPPSMDFLASEDIDPIAMYIFEFSQVLSKQDLADIWQGLYPDATATMEAAESSISHPLLAHELLGGGAVRVNENDELFLDQGAKGNKFNDRLKWMVFKVKQRAKINYFDNIVSRAGDEFPGAIVDSTGVNVNVSYNWPYDYFSLVELGKIDAEVSLGKFKDKGKKELLEPVIPDPEPEPTPAPAESFAISTGVGLTEEAQSSMLGGGAGLTAGMPDFD